MQSPSFLEIFSASLTYLSNPWIIFSVMGLLIFYFFYGLGIHKITEVALLKTKEGDSTAGPGCLTQFLGVFVQAFIVALFLLLLIPILVGARTDLSWQEVEPLGFVAIRAGLLSMIVVALLSFLPWIGNSIAASPGLEFFTLAALSYRFLLPIYLEAYLGRPIELSQVYPGYLKLGLYFILTFILTGLLRWAMGKISRARALQWTVDLIGGLLIFLWIAAEVSYRVRDFLPVPSN